MKFERKLSTEGKDPAMMISWRGLSVKIDGNDVLVGIPSEWSDIAGTIFATKYLRKAGVPSDIQRVWEKDVCHFLFASEPNEAASFGMETSARQVLHRLAGAWTYHGWKMALFNDEKHARIFYDELYLILAKQLAAPNSPQWFNTGLWWAYGIEGSASGQWAINYDLYSERSELDPEQRVFETTNAYEFPQPHACFIQPVNDDLVNPGGIMDLWTREVRLFKQGSGTGTNFSNIRSKGERLSGGGISSGLMSFLEIGDRAAGAIKSGGTTRRAAKMVIVDADHPEIEDFIDWKVCEEQKAAAMWLGSWIANDPSLFEKLPSDLIERIGDHTPDNVFSIDYEGEAIRTVGGQNSNNSVRVTDGFMNLLGDPQGAMWYTKERITRKLGKGFQVGYLWDKICRAAWASADPGLQFHDTINKWHTCKVDGEIRASNPCSEYMFLDNTACNLASLNLGKFYKPKKLQDLEREFDTNLFCHVARLMTVVLDISVSMASFPSREIAIGSYNYRTLGLGYANLGGLLMRMGLSYDSNEGCAVASSITALLHGVAYKTSSELATELGPFPRWEANKYPMRDVVIEHGRAVSKIRCIGEAGKIVNEALRVWNSLNYDGPFRNAQVTLLAPTGTIGLLMDCDTLGVEPDYSLVKRKNLAGGGTMVLINQAVEEALTKLGYKTHVRNLILAYIKEHGTAEGCPDILPEHLAVFDCANPPEGFSRSIRPMAHVEMVAAVQPFLSGAVSKTINMPNSATVEDVSEVYMQAWKLGLKAVSIYRDGSKLAQPLSSAKEKQKIEIPIGKGQTLSLKGRLMPATEFRKSEYVFADLDFDLDKPPMHHLPHEKVRDDELWECQKLEKSPQELQRGQREYLPWRREAATQKVKVGPTGQSIHLTIGRYPDGRPGEIRIDYSRAGTTLAAMTDMVAMMISIGLQYGVPVEEYVKLLAGRKFEPSGMVEGHDKIKWTASLADLIACELGIEFLGREEMGQVGQVKTNGDLTPANVESAQYPIPIKAMRDICPECQEPCLIRSGTCQTCTACGYNDGCGG